MTTQPDGSTDQPDSAHSDSAHSDSAHSDSAHSDSDQPDMSHPGPGLTGDEAQRVAGLGTQGDASPQYLAMDGDSQSGRGADGDTAAREADQDDTA